LALLLAVQAQDGAVLEVLEGQRAQLAIGFTAQDGFGLAALVGRDEGDRGLDGHPDALGAFIGGQPEFDLGTRGGVAPMAGQQEALPGWQGVGLGSVRGRMAVRHCRGGGRGGYTVHGYSILP
jgi:hypothetical protein